MEAKGLLVMLVDQPLISVDDLTRLAVGWRAAPDLPAASAYGGIVGVPAIFPRSCFADLLQLQGDQGAKSLLQDYAEKTIVDIAAAAFDIDTEEDLRHLH